MKYLRALAKALADRAADYVAERAFTDLGPLELEDFDVPLLPADFGGAELPMVETAPEVEVMGDLLWVFTDDALRNVFAQARLEENDDLLILALAANANWSEDFTADDEGEDD